MIDITKVCPDKECDMRCSYDVHNSASSEDSANICLSCEG